jgi:hypothetical protein
VNTRRLAAAAGADAAKCREWTDPPNKTRFESNIAALTVHCLNFSRADRGAEVQPDCAEHSYTRADKHAHSRNAPAARGGQCASATETCRSRRVPELGSLRDELNRPGRAIYERPAGPGHAPWTAPWGCRSCPSWTTELTPVSVLVALTTAGALEPVALWRAWLALTGLALCCRRLRCAQGQQTRRYQATLAAERRRHRRWC